MGLLPLPLPPLLLLLLICTLHTHDAIAAKKARVSAAPRHTELDGDSPLPQAIAREAQLLHELSAKIEAIGLRIAHTEKELATTAREGITLVPLRARFGSAEHNFLRGDHVHACATLLELIEQPASKKETWYPTALYYAAESHFRMTNTGAARAMYQRLLALGHTRYMGWAVRRLMHIADTDNDWATIEKIIAQVGRPPWSPDVAYGYAKSLLRQHKTADAIRIARTIDTKDPLYPQGLYLIAVAQLLQNQPDQATETFASITKLTPRQDPRGAYIQELAWMDQGRIALDQHDADRALAAYEHVAPESPLFDEALYEMGWTSIDQGNNAKDDAARRRAYANALTMFRQLVPQEIRTHRHIEVRLLIGHLWVQLQRYDEAIAVFQDIVREYAPLVQDVNSILAAATAIDPHALFSQIVQHQPSDMTYPVPSVAADWLDAKDEMHQAAKLLHDMHDSMQWLDDAHNILAGLQWVLDKEGPGQFFPRFRDLHARKRVLDHGVLAMHATMAQALSLILQPYLTEAQTITLQQWQTDQRALQIAFEHIPADEAEASIHVAVARSEIGRLQHEVQYLGGVLHTQRASLSALNQWWVDRPTGFTPAQRTAIHLQLAEQSEITTTLDVAFRALQNELLNNGDMMIAEIGAQTVESPIRAQYAAAVDGQIQMLLDAEKELGKSMTGNAVAWLAQWHTHATTVQTLQQKIGQLAVEIDRAAQVRAAAMRHVFDQLGNTLDQENSNAIALHSESQALAAQVASASMQDVADQLRAMMFHGEVGVTDVAWGRKEEETRVINDRLTRQQVTTQFIDEHYAEPRGPYAQ